MSTPDELSFWTKAATWVAGGAATLAGLVWGDMKRRVNNVEKELKSKAEKLELDRNRDHVANLFTEQIKIRKEMNEGFSQVKDMMHEYHTEILRELSHKADR